MLLGRRPVPVGGTAPAGSHLRLFQVYTGMCCACNRGGACSSEVVCQDGMEWRWFGGGFLSVGDKLPAATRELFLATAIEVPKGSPYIGLLARL